MNDLICVFDVETTGLPRQHERIVEFAAVLIDLDGNEIERFETLVNPCRDVGPVDIHGICASDVLEAPTFSDICGDIAQFVMRAKAIAAHNLPFDRWFLNREFERQGIALPQMMGFCTLSYFGEKLHKACELYAIENNGNWHSAIADAVATSRLTALMIEDEKPLLASEFQTLHYEWPSIPNPSGTRCTRTTVQERRAARPSFVTKILSSIDHDNEASDSDVLAYLELIEEVLEDRIIDADEEVALVEVASNLGLSKQQVCSAHEMFLNDLVLAAWADNILTECEKQDLAKVACLLGISEKTLQQKIEDAKAHPVSEQGTNAAKKCKDDLVGKSVCITGTLSGTIQGKKIDRTTAYRLSEKAGLIPMKAVTKKLDLLVSSDANSQSGKMQKARQYGVRVFDENVFWSKLGIMVD